MRAVCLAVLLLASFVLLAGCPGPKPQPPPVAGPEHQPPAPVTARFTYSEKACYAPVVVAVEEGYYAAEGLTIEKKVVTGGIESAEAMISGQADFGTMGDAPTVIALSRSKGLKLICGQAVGPRMHRLVVRNDGGIKAPADLAGKKVAVQLGSSTHGAFLQYLQRNDVDEKKIQFVSLSPRDFPEAMISKQVDAIAGSEPWPGNVMAKCKDSHELANLESPDNNYPLPIMARAAFLQEHPEVAAAVVRAALKAVKLLHDSPQKGAEIQAKASGLTPERELKGMADYEWQVELDAKTIASLKQTAEFLHAQKKIPQVPDLDAAIDPRGLEAVVGAASR
ncbi:MAG: ABC transporter substrate-binding protein [Armatimonadetes bacterium]|nr:ABC transporter substrate-binding protein [Armatimonadota bacterium]